MINALSHMLFRAVLVAACLMVISLPMLAQSEPEQHFTFNVGGGVSPVVGSLNDRFNTGWHLTGGAAYQVTSPFSIGLQFGFNSFGLSNSFLQTAGTPDGNARLWLLTLDPTLRLSTMHGVQPYIVGGVGFYRRAVDFTTPVLQQVVVFDPFFGFLQGAVPANQVLKTAVSNAIGGNLGLGFSFGLPNSSRARLFVEGRYHYADTRSVPTRLVPITFGIRF